MDYAIITAAIVAYLVAFAVLALGEGIREYLDEKTPEDGRTSRFGPGQGLGPGHAPGPG